MNRCFALPTLVLALFTLSCGGGAKNDPLALEPGGCLVVKSNFTGEYAFAQLNHFPGADVETCERLSKYLTDDGWYGGTSSRYRCICK